MNIIYIIKKVFSNRVAKNASWLIGGKIAQMLISLVMGILIARYLGPSNYGLVNYGAAYVAFFLSMCTLGINSVIVKELIDNRGKEGEILGTAILLKGIASIIAAVLIVVIVEFVDSDERTTIIVVALCSIGLIFNVLETFNYWFQSRLQSKVTAIATLIAFMITAGYKVLLLITGKPVQYFALSSSLDYICIGIGLFVAYRKHGGNRLSFSWRYGKTLLKKSTPFILPSLMVAIYGQTDKMMLKEFLDSSEVGYYSTAVSICTAWCFVLSAIIDSMYPVIMEAKSNDDEDYIRKNKLLYSIVFFVSFAASIVFTIIAEPVISILFGESYLPAIAPLRIITWYTAFSYLGVARNAWVVCENKQDRLKYVYITAAALNVLLNLWMIPRWGASGAAFASLTAQVLTTLVVPMLMPSLRKNTLMMIEAICLKGILWDK